MVVHDRTVQWIRHGWSGNDLNGAKWNGVARSGTNGRGAKRSGMEWNGMERSEGKWNGADWRRLMQSQALRNQVEF